MAGTEPPEFPQRNTGEPPLGLTLTAGDMDAVGDLDVAPAPVRPLPKGHIAIDSTPWVRVSLEGETGSFDLGFTPLDTDIPAGTYTAVLENETKGISRSTRITVEEAATLRVRYDFAIGAGDR